MERNANYALVGAFSLLIFVAMIAFVIWLARIQFARDYDNYDILFIGPVRGLTEGGEVHFNGIKVGEVTKIALDRADPKRVIAKARVTSDVPIRVDSFATLEPQGITGVNYVQITAGTASQPLLKDVTPLGKTPVIRSQNSTLSDLLEGGGALLTRAVEALNRVNRVLSDQNIKAMTSTFHNIDEVSTEARNQKQIFADADSAIRKIDAAADNISQLSASADKTINGDGKKAVNNISDAADELKKAARSARETLDKLQGPTTDFATTGLPQLQQSIAAMQSAAEALERLANEAQRSPRSLVGKPPAQEEKVKP